MHGLGEFIPSSFKLFVLFFLKPSAGPACVHRQRGGQEKRERASHAPRLLAGSRRHSGESRGGLLRAGGRGVVLGAAPPGLEPPRLDSGECVATKTLWDAFRSVEYTSGWSEDV